MAEEGNDVEQDLSHIHWSWPEAVAANPARSLATADLAMDYFAYSPFFDTNSNNSVLRTQRRVENPAYGHAEEKIELNAFRGGFEYIVAHSEPPEMFIIHRRNVQPDGSRASVSAAYFILQEKVYPTPTLYGVMAARLRNASHLVSSTFSTLSAAHPPANPRATSQWRSLPPSAAGADTAQAQASEDVDMDQPTPPNIPTQPTASKKKSAKAPDYHLFNALQSTRLALSDLDKLAAAPPPAVDPRDELRAIEARMMGKQKTGPGQGGPSVRVGAGAGSGPGGMGGTPSARGGVASPAVSMAGGPGRAQSIGTSGMGQSPAVR